MAAAGVEKDPRMRVQSDLNGVLRDPDIFSGDLISRTGEQVQQFMELPGGQIKAERVFPVGLVHLYVAGLNVLWGERKDISQSLGPIVPAVPSKEKGGQNGQHSPGDEKLLQLVFHHGSTPLCDS